MPAAISIMVKALKQDYCFLIRPFDTQFDTVETAVTEAAKRCSLLVVTSRNIQDHLKWIENVEYGILAARLVVAVCSPRDVQQTLSARVTFSEENPVGQMGNEGLHAGLVDLVRNRTLTATREHP